VIPLSDAAIEVLESMRPLSGHSAYVFVGLKGPLTTIQKPLGRIRKNSGIHFTLHDLRRTSATMLGELGTPLEVTSAILNHALPAPAATAIYERSSRIPQMRIALEKLASHIERIVSGKARAEVLPFTRS
jgi:integrase